MKSYLNCFVLASTSLTVLCSCSGNQPESKEPELLPKGKVVYCSNDIPQGSEVAIDSLEEKEINETKIPKDAIRSSSSATGKISKYGFSQGHLICQHELMEPGTTPSVSVNLDYNERKKLDAIAKSKNKALAELASEWVTERLNKTK